MKEIDIFISESSAPERTCEIAILKIQIGKPGWLFCLFCGFGA